ncbi:hypothetical protein AR438_04170 [Chryseobacterium aquaticum]|uniref:Outer membrane protein beta-barrel domain-containing protein n=1 Tax=Chryseobacterium aquaticum TaxID=452084 RepID=A0A0Q3KSL1_9FLAO|nr:hypothetical protein [Chryseobacterium aquaticum]KQK27404.1 hypothetical protein AR438_04170 [Chryseobacterium aquaticum]
MKTQIIFSTFLLFLAMNLNAQEINKEKNDSILLSKKSKLIIYDFAEGRFDLKRIAVKRNEPVAIKIKNINPFFYRIDVKSNDKTISYQNADKQELNSVIADIKQMNYYKIQEQYSFEQEIIPINIETNEKENSKESLRKLVDLLNKRTELKNQDQILQRDIKVLNNKSEISKIQMDSLNILNKGSLEKQANIATIETDINKLITQTKSQNMLKTFLNSRTKKLNDMYAAFEKNAREILKLNQNYNNYIDKVITSEMSFDMYQSILKNQKREVAKNDILPQIETTFLLDEKKLMKAYTTFREYRDSYQMIQNELNAFATELNYTDLDILKNKDFVKGILFKDIERFQKSVKSIDEVVQKINLSKKLNQVEILDRLLRKESTFEYISAPIQGEEDYLEFDVEIRSKRNMEDTFHVDNDKSFVYKNFIDGGVRFDVSVGTVFDFFTTDKKYTLSAENVVQRLDNNKYNPTIAAIFHASFRTHNAVAYGISLGTSFTTNFSFNSLFPGFSILFGKTNKVILTVGPSFRSVDELKTNYLEGQKLTSGIADEDLLTKNFRVGVFFGISYNLTQKQQSSMKLGQ